MRGDALGIVMTGVARARQLMSLMRSFAQPNHVSGNVVNDECVGARTLRRVLDFLVNHFRDLV